MAGYNKKSITSMDLVRHKKMLRYLEDGNIEPVKNYFIQLIDTSLQDISRRGCAAKFSKENKESATGAELKMRDILNEAGIIFLEQKEVFYNDRNNFYIVDYYLPSDKIAIEVDGGYHNDPNQIEKDKIRDEVLLNKKIKTLRFRNSEVSDKEHVLSKIKSHIRVF